MQSLDTHFYDNAVSRVHRWSRAHGCMFQVRKDPKAKQPAKAYRQACTVLTSAQTMAQAPEHIGTCGLFLHPQIHLVPLNFGWYCMGVNFGFTAQAPAHRSHTMADC